MTEPAGWTRLDARMLAVAPAQELVRFLPLLVGALLVGRGEQPVWALAVLVLAGATGVLRWLTTRYRVDAERVEVRSGIVVRQHRSVPRDRVRTVDLTANLLHRLFGLAVLRVGTGRQAESKEQELSLDAVSAPEAERLRSRLLDRSPVAVPATTGPYGDAAKDSAEDPAMDGAVAAGGAADAVELARISWAWLRFAPLTVFGVVAVGALAGTVWQLLEQFGMSPTDLTAVRAAADWVVRSPTWLAIAAPVAALVVIGTVGALVLYLEAWWRYRLTRHPDGTLQVNRGLLTRRSVSIEERRVRGVTVNEPLLLRAGGGASCDAVATGSGGGRAHLLPPAPTGHAHQVAAAVLREADPPTLVPLRRHPAAARRRRHIRAVLPALVLVAALALISTVGAWLPGWLWLIVAALLLPLAVLLGADRYRGLGHAGTAGQLVMREGSIARQTVALQLQGVIGWRIEQSIFQRRAGLATVTATTAAGSGAYRILDVELAEGLRTADAATPGLLAPFLRREP